jgi:hypothetical protein
MEEESQMNELEEFEFRARAEQENTVHTDPSMLDVAGNAVVKAVAGVVNTPVDLWNMAKTAAGAMHPQIKEEATMTPNYPLKGAEAVGLYDPAKEPVTAEQRYVDTAIQTAISAAASPAKGLMGVARNLATGAISGTAGQAAKELTGSDLLKVATGVATSVAVGGFSAKQADNLTPTGAVTLKDARKAGYVVQPSTVASSAVGNKLESVAGKAAIAQDAAIRNQAVTNKLAARAIGLADDAPITMASIEDVREKAGKIYNEVDELRSTTKMDWFPRFHSTSLSEDLKQARADANKFYKAYDRMGDPAMLERAESASNLAKSIEGDLERIAKAAGKPELIDKLKAARQLYARTFVVERSLNLGDGNVSAAMIGRMLDHGQPLTGELKVIGKFAQAFPRVTRDASAVPPAAVAGTDAFSSAMLGTIGYGAVGGPAGLAAAGLPLLRSPARRFILSERYQSGLTAPPDAGPAIRGAMIGKSLSDYDDIASQ